MHLSTDDDNLLPLLFIILFFSTSGNEFVRDDLNDDDESDRQINVDLFILSRNLLVGGTDYTLHMFQLLFPHTYTYMYVSNIKTKEYGCVVFFVVD